MKTATNFYDWWMHTVKGNYITDTDFDLVLERFDDKNEKT